MNMDNEITLDNGRKYKVVDTGRPYGRRVSNQSSDLVESGGYVVYCWHDEQWSYICHSPDLECLSRTFRAFARLPSLN